MVTTIRRAGPEESSFWAAIEKSTSTHCVFFYTQDHLDEQ